MQDHGRITRFAGLLTVRAAAGVVVGILAGWAVTRLDRLLGWALPVAPATVEALLAAFVGGVLTIAVFALWMRTVVVGLVAAQVSARVLASYLDDRFQQRIIGVMVAGLAWLATLMVLLPNDGDTVPLLTTVIALAIVVGALIGVLLAMRHAVSSLAMPNVVRTLTDQILRLLDREPWPNEPAPTEIPGPGEHGQHLDAQALGWIQHIDHERLLDHVPDGATLVLQVDVGDFVAPGEHLGHLDVEVDDETADAVVECLTIERTRSPAQDLAFAVQQLVDVVHAALAPASTDTSTAHEGLAHLRAVLHLLLRRGTATACSSAGGRAVVSAAAWRPVDHLTEVFDRLVPVARDPASIRALHRTVSVLERTAIEVGDDASGRVLRHHRDTLEAAGGSPDPSADAGGADGS